MVSPSDFAERIVHRVNELFPETDRDEIFARLDRHRAHHSAMGTERIHFDILHLSGGDKKTLPGWIVCAEYECRDGQHIKRVIPDGFKRP